MIAEQPSLNQSVVGGVFLFFYLRNLASIPFISTFIESYPSINQYRIISLSFFRVQSTLLGRYEVQSSFLKNPIHHLSKIIVLGSAGNLFMATIKKARGAKKPHPPTSMKYTDLLIKFLLQLAGKIGLSSYCALLFRIFAYVFVRAQRQLGLFKNL